MSNQTMTTSTRTRAALAATLAGALGMMIVAAPAPAAAQSATARVPAPAQADTALLQLAPDSRLWLAGGSNLHDWKCEAGRLDVEVAVRPGERGADGAGAIPSAVHRVRVGVPVGAIDCGNGTMEGKLRDALRASDHPAIVFRMTDYALVPETAEPDAFTMAVTGTLEVAGTSRTIDVTVQGTALPSGALEVAGSTELLMTDYGVKPPTAMFGVLKTDDRVTVGFELVASYRELAARLGTDAHTIAAYLARGDYAGDHRAR